MSNLYQYIGWVLCLTILYSSCDTVDYGDTNDNPNGPTKGVTSLLLANSLSNIPDIVIDETPILYMQHITEGQYPGASRYSGLTYSYDDWYVGPLQDLNKIIELNSDPETADDVLTYGSNDNQIAVAKIVRAYFLHYMTDRWGALPWSEAFMGIDNPQPKFDTQESIYDFLFAEIEEALSLIDYETPAPDGDFLFDGDLERWASFANNLKMTMALRISDVKPGLAQTKFEEAVASGLLVMSNDDNIEYHYGTDDNSDSPWNDNFKTREDYILSRTMIESLRDNLDPRLFKYAEPARDSVSTVTKFPDGMDAGYVGAPNGKVNGDVPNYSFMPAEIIYTPDYPSPIYTAAQVKFALAEAAGKGWNVGGSDAATLYEEAIVASMEYWGISEEDTADYIADHPYGDIEDIAYEKWVALYLNGPEAWAEWRRLDAPSLTPSSFANDPRIPVRHAYDASIADNNKANYDEMISFQGPDNLHTRLWWDVK
ncbi:SusD/RagB family nutrient-binding outer membrane lipoprotein [Sinomicrobium weinanense]|uniref:SusD/RagB family nutrient-binding outer membrane lipoprotein n=1 Tax=Sinomicrobium weinanense TaxID=2842200 RepID=A0A926JRW8_9FLAO|nr:SusD/RagB family nutrient-binding outer membrane lipoprotein [Sinomicrobium weinanense]MBC9796370.1 SusD/RagB family nutrient-binding outer membrane lipoprotein [Sinomicrobium weinanense]MBU3122629.1 SusD/RagB family nutrient-binding outer membrane lipoprotein [Sinomicrobium weinanense]